MKKQGKGSYYCYEIVLQKWLCWSLPLPILEIMTALLFRKAFLSPLLLSTFCSEKAKVVWKSKEKAPTIVLMVTVLQKWPCWSLPLSVLETMTALLFRKPFLSPLLPLIFFLKKAKSDEKSNDGNCITKMALLVTISANFWVCWLPPMPIFETIELLPFRKPFPCPLPLLTFC